MQDHGEFLMVQILLFSVEEIRCAIPLGGTSQVIRMVKPGTKTSATPWETGTINLRGTIIPVISMRSVFGLTESPPRLTDMLIIAHAGSGDVALWVDATNGVQDIPDLPDIQTIPVCGELETPGIGRTAEGMLYIHDLSLLIGRDSVVPLPEIPSLLSKEELPVTDFTRIDALLEERAKKIAQPEDEISEAGLIEILKFRLAYQEFALEMQYIREVILTGEITPVPGTPDYISGICVVRGEIISLVDLRVLLSIPEKGLTDLNRVIVMKNETLSFGILADHITGIGILNLNKMSLPETGAMPIPNNYLKGIAEGPLIVLDAAALFADPKMIIEDT
jgi:purine-binding chemotaxis protein CheW